MSARTMRQQRFPAPAAMLPINAIDSGAARAAALDAELLAACAHYGRLEAAYRATAGGQEDMVTPEGYLEAISTVADLPARTPEGLRAKAGAILAFHAGRDCQEDEAHLGPHRALEWSLVMDVAGRPPGVSASLVTADIDRELLAACAAFQQAEAAVKASDDDSRSLSDAEWATLVDAPGRAWWNALAVVNGCALPQTKEGVRAKAQAAHAALSRLHGGEDLTCEAQLALSCLADVVGRVEA